jgi:hypothetical protein
MGKMPMLHDDLLTHRFLERLRNIKPAMGKSSKGDGCTLRAEGYAMTTGYDSGAQILKMLGGVGCIFVGFLMGMNLLVILIGVALLAWLAFGD